MEFKDRLKNLRQESGLSQEALAKTIYVSRSAIAKWENGLGIPSDANLQELCEYFNVSEDWLLDRRDLKNQIKDTKRQLPIYITAVFGITTPLIYVLLGFILTAKQSVFISMYYPPVTLFDFVVNYIEAPHYAPICLFICSLVVWTATVAFAISTITVGKLRQRTLICCCINWGLIALSLAMFLTLFFVTVQTPHPIYIF